MAKKKTAMAQLAQIAQMDSIRVERAENGFVISGWRPKGGEVRRIATTTDEVKKEIAAILGSKE